MTKQKPVKISFIGDIMCEKPLLQAARTDEGYNFHPVFEQAKELFNDTDYVVGNLETVCAGEKAGYTDHIYSFNTPDSFIEAIKTAGIDLVSTANNHCLDRGIDGLKRTHQLLEQYGIEQVGTNLTQNQDHGVLKKSFGESKVAFLSYTYGTNLQINKVKLAQDEINSINLLQPQEAGLNSKQQSSIKGIFFKQLFKVLTVEQWVKIKRFLRLPGNKPSIDNSLQYLDENYLGKFKENLKYAKENADFVILCLHSGGQFNSEPGRFTEYIMDITAEQGIDMVVGTHPHVVQRFELTENTMPAFFSLGSFSISPSSPYLIHDYLPDYSIMVHVYLKKRTLSKVTFTILKAIEDRQGMLTVWPVDKLFHTIEMKAEKQKLAEDAVYIYNRLLGTDKVELDLLREYPVI